MRYRRLAIAMFLVLPVLAAAQESGRAFRSYGYGFAGVAKWTSGENATGHFGAGGVARIAGNLGATADAGYLYCGVCTGAKGAGLLSLGAIYQFPGPNRSRFLPYVTGGYSRWFSPADWGPSANMTNIGAGFDYWFRPHAGFKLDVRDHFAQFSGKTQHLVDLRFGFTFR